jgi:hypothetical protein
MLDCPSANSNMKMSTEQWWNDTDREKPKYWERKLSQHHSVYYKSTRTDLGSKAGLMAED